MVTVMKATLTIIFLFLSILAGLAKSEQWKPNDQSQAAENSSSGLSSFLEHVLAAQDEINWVKKVFQHEKGTTKEQCLQPYSQQFPSSENFEMLDSDSNDQLNAPVQNIEWKPESSGENFASDFMYDSSQTQLKSKNTGARFKRRSADQLDEDPKLKEIVRNNIDNLHMLNFSPEKSTDIHMIAETSNINTEGDTSIERRGTGQTDSNEEPSLENLAQKGGPCNSMINAYFTAHGRRQANRRQSISSAHSRGVRVDLPDLLSGVDLQKTWSEKAEQEHQRLQLEDADGLLKGKRIGAHIGSIDNQMSLDKEKSIKQTNKTKFLTLPSKESKITSRDSQSQDNELPLQIKLDLLNDPLYNKVDLTMASQNMNVGNDKSEKSVIMGTALDNHLLSSVNEYLAGVDQQRQQSPKRDEPELEMAQIFVNKKDTSSQQVKWDESAGMAQPLRPAQVNAFQNIADKDFYSASKDMRQLLLTQKNQDIAGDFSQPASEQSTSKIQNQFLAMDQGLLQSSRDKRTIVKRPGVIWRENTGNEDLEEEPETENEGKGVILFESEESDVDGKISRNGNVGPSKSYSDDDYSFVSEFEQPIEDANEEKSNPLQYETNNVGLNQEYRSHDSDLDDAARVKASVKFLSKYDPILETNDLQKADDWSSESKDNHLVRKERTIKKTHKGNEPGKLTKRKENEGPVGETSNSNSYHEQRTENKYLDDPNRFKASLKFSSEFVSPLDSTNIQESEDLTQSIRAFDSHDSNPMRSEREIKKSFQYAQTFADGSDRNVLERKSREHKPVASADDTFEDSNNSNMQREGRDNPLQMYKSHSSRSLLSCFEPTNTMHNLANERRLSPSAKELFHSKQEEKGENEGAKYLADSLSTIIHHQLLNGNLPPLIRVKRFPPTAATTHDKNFSQLGSEIFDVKQSPLDEKLVEQNVGWESSPFSAIWSTFDKDLNKQSAFNQDSIHDNAKRSAIHPSANNMEIFNLDVNQELADVQFNKQGSTNHKSVLEDMKQSVYDTYLDEEVSADVDADQNAIFENVLSRKKRAHAHAKRSHRRGKGPTAREAGRKARGGKGAEKSEWKINIRSTKHTQRNDEDEDEKEYESSDFNISPGKGTKRELGQSDLKELHFGKEEASNIGVDSINFSINDLVGKTEDENEYESSQVEKDKDYDVVRRHIQHGFNKRHPVKKYVEPASIISNIGDKGMNDEIKIEDYLTKEQEEEKESKPNEILPVDRFKRASNYDDADRGKIKTELLSMPGLSNNDMGNINLIRSSKSLSRSDLKPPFENVNKFEYHPVDFNPAVIPFSKTIDQCSPDKKNNFKLAAINEDNTAQGSVLPRSDLHEIHEMRLAGTKLSDSPAYGINLKTSVPNSNGKYDDMKQLVPANEQVPEPHVRCAEKCTTTPACLDASRVSTTNPSCSTKCEGPGSQLRTERKVDRRRGIADTPKLGQSEGSADCEYKGELDDGRLGTEIVQAIFQQVQKIPSLKKTLACGLSLIYHPPDIKETNGCNSHSQEMMHQIMQLINQSVDEEVKSRTCTSLTSDLEGFIAWLMKNEKHPGSTTENPYLLESNSAKAPAVRHLEELDVEDIERQISLRNQLICEYNELDKCDQDVVKPIKNYLSEQKTFLTTLLQKSESKPGCDKRTVCSKKPGCGSDLEQPCLLEETMDSFGSGPNGMPGSNIGDEVIFGMSMADEGAEQLNDADGASIAQGSVTGNSQMGSQDGHYDRPPSPGCRKRDVYRIQRDAEDEYAHERNSQNSRRNPNDERGVDVVSDDDYGAADFDDVEANYDGKVANDYASERRFKYSSRGKGNRNTRRSTRKSYFVPSQKYKRLVALALELKRKKRTARRRKHPFS